MLRRASFTLAPNSAPQWTEDGIAILALLADGGCSGLARIEANDRGADEALLLEHGGYVAEATVDNVFIVTDHALVAPPTATNLKGVTRVDWDLLRTIQRLTASGDWEIKSRTAADWELAILTGFSVWREVVINDGGTVAGDLMARSLVFVE